MAGMKTATGDYIDSSWELRVFVGEEDPEAESVTLRVTGESHIGGVLLKIVEEISECPSALLATSAPGDSSSCGPMALPCCIALNKCHSDSGTSLIIWFQKRHLPHFPPSQVIPPFLPLQLVLLNPQGADPATVLHSPTSGGRSSFAWAEEEATFWGSEERPDGAPGGLRASSYTSSPRRKPQQAGG